MKLGYVIIYVEDVLATLAFYERAFGLKRRFVHEDQQYAEMETGATALAFVAEDFAAQSVADFRRNRATGAPPGVNVSLLSDDPARDYQAALDAGATAVVPPIKKPWGQTVSYLRDCNGLLVEICSPVTP